MTFCVSPSKFLEIKHTRTNPLTSVSRTIAPVHQPMQSAFSNLFQVQARQFQVIPKIFTIFAIFMIFTIFHDFAISSDFCDFLRFLRFSRDFRDFSTIFNGAPKMIFTIFCRDTFFSPGEVTINFSVHRAHRTGCLIFLENDFFTISLLRFHDREIYDFFLVGSTLEHL